MLARESLELGALAYIDKPFDLGYLKRVVAIVFSRDALQMIAVKEVNDGLRVLRISIDCAGDELELLLAAGEAYRGHHVYQTEA